MNRASSLIFFSFILLAVSLAEEKDNKAEVQPEKKELKGPITLRNSNHFSSDRNQEVYNLSGNVHFQIDDVNIFAEFVDWYNDKSLLKCRQDLKIFHKSGEVYADHGVYEKSKDLLTAHKDILVKDSKDEVHLSGDFLKYYMEQKHLLITKNPEVRRIFRDSVDQKKTDTLFIWADTLKFDDANKKANAIGKVKLVYQNLTVTGDSGTYDINTGAIHLTGDPVATVDSYELKGLNMDLKLEGEILKEMSVIDSATGVKQELVRKAVNRVSKVKGDTIHIDFMKNKVENLWVRNQATSDIVDDDRQDFPNEMKGNDILLEFHKGLLKNAKIYQKAYSKYHFFSEEGAMEGRNEVMGDSIYIDFKKRKMTGIQIFGNKAEGNYYGEEKELDGNAPKDTVNLKELKERS